MLRLRDRRKAQLLKKKYWRMAQTKRASLFWAILLSLPGPMPSSRLLKADDDDWQIEDYYVTDKN